MRIGGKFEARMPGRFETPFGGKVGANMQFLEIPKRLAISLNGTWSRMCQRRIIPNNATSITPIPHSMQ